MAEVKYKSPEDLERKIEKFFDADMLFHSRPAMLEFLDIGVDTYLDMQNGTGLYKDKGFSKIVKKAENRRQLELVNLGLSDKEKSVFSMFLLKQDQNGGYRDRPKDDSDNKPVSITINGVTIDKAAK
jgi:hypothetical protein